MKKWKGYRLIESQLQSKEEAKRFVARLEKKALQKHHSKQSSKHAKPSTCTESAEQAQKSTPAITPSSTLASATQNKSKKRKLRLSVLEQLVKKGKNTTKSDDQRECEQLVYKNDQGGIDSLRKIHVLNSSLTLVRPLSIEWETCWQ